MKSNKKLAGLIIFIFVLVLLASGGYLIYAFTGGSGSLNVTLAVVAGILFLISFVLLIAIISKYNKMVKYKNKVEESLSLIDIQLKLRFDLIPNLVSTVKGYANHEKQVLTEITKLRNLAANSTDEKEKIEYANKLVPKIRQIIAIAENYPDLKADALFRSLMEELVLVEDKIVAARRFYDSNVAEFNTLVAVWPNNIIAKLFGFGKLELFKIDAGERLNVNVNLG